ncbi:DinB family protein [Fictibacillus sp. FJAT-27399]|uniref:DinB family protein n=1 Tax=Fictibacillus sp. FJAT-27399 TaxID=1729689 RepID=UPI0007823EF3|nr:DinB family protein [Fictibacillus sp. FJAT-27399]
MSLLKSFAEQVDWLEELRTVKEELWLEPISSGKWSIGEVVSHFKAWDLFVIHHRLPYFLEHQAFPENEVDSERMNQDASRYAKFGVSKFQLLQEAIETRANLVQQLQMIPEEWWIQSFYYKNKTLTLAAYIEGLSEHDKHHQNQISLFLQKTANHAG